MNYGLNYMPSALFTPFAGAFVEKRSKKSIMVLTDLGRGLIVTLIAGLTLTGLVKAWMLLMSTFLISTLEAFRKPCGSTVITDLIPKEMYSHATSLSNSLSQATELIGTAAAGVIIGLSGIGSAIFIDALTFFLSALLIAVIHFPPIVLPEKQPPVLAQFRGGLTYINNRKHILLVCMTAAIMNLCLVPHNSLQSALSSEVYGMGSEILSIIGASVSIGIILGSLLYPAFKKKLRIASLLFTGFLTISLFLTGCALIAYLTTWPILFYGALIAICLMLGISVALNNVTISVALLQSTDPDYLARVMAIFSSISICAIPLGSFLVSFLASFLSVETIHLGTGALALFFTLLMKFAGIFD